MQDDKKPLNIHGIRDVKKHFQFGYNAEEFAHMCRLASQGLSKMGGNIEGFKTEMVHVSPPSQAFAVDNNRHALRRILRRHRWRQVRAWFWARFCDFFMGMAWGMGLVIGFTIAVKIL